jgi:hypothetical protein
MSDRFFPPGQPALMSPDKARDIARSFKALAAQFEDAGDDYDAQRMERQSQWWLTYATVLAQTPPGEDTGESPVREG